MRAFATLAYSALGAVLVAAFLAAPSGLARSAVFDAGAPLAALGIVCGILLYKPPCRRAWGLAAAGLLISGGGDVIYDVESHVGSAPGLPSAADVFFLAGYVLFLAGLVVYARDEERTAGWSALVDAAIVSAGAALLLWSSMPAPETVGAHLASGVVAAAYPTADVLLLVIVASLLFSRTRPFMVSDALLLGCIALLLAADVLHAQLSVSGRT